MTRNTSGSNGGGRDDGVDSPEPRRGVASDATKPLASFLRHRGPSESVPVLAEEALRAIRDHLDMDVAFIAEFTASERVFRHVDARLTDCPVQVGGADRLENTYCQRVVDGRLPELIPDAGALPAAAELPVTAALPVGAHLSVPIRLADGRVFGTFCCFSARPDHSLNDRDLAMMRVFADLTAVQIERDEERKHRHEKLVARLRAAMNYEGLTMVLQPIVDIDTGQPFCFEALARFNVPPLRGPAAWFAEAAEVGLGVELELAAVQRALHHLPALPAGVGLSLNVSPDTAVSGALDALLRDQPAHRIVVEITEHDVIDAYDELEAALGGLRRRGVRIAVDDAGAGYASFRHILRLRPDIIKLDMTLTRDIDRDPGRRALASALIAFARDTASALVAEGVETHDELSTLRRLGVRAAQGYLFGRPGRLSELTSRGILIRR